MLDNPSNGYKIKTSVASKPRNFNPDFYYHVFNRSVQEKEAIFNNQFDYQRFISTLSYYIYDRPISFEQHQRLAIPANPKGLFKRICLLAYVLMPNHFHFLVKPLEDTRGISRFVSDVTNSYTRYFNLKNHRLGTLFQGTFKAKEVKDEPSLLQVTRYIHLNPLISAKANPKGLLRKPEDYPFTSYHEWIGIKNSHIADEKEVNFWTSKIGGVKGYRAFVESKIKSDPSLGIEDLVIE